MNEYFIVANSFAAPFFSDQSTHFIAADSAEDALDKFILTYKHPLGLYSAAAYFDANDFHKGFSPMASYLSPKAEKDAA